VATDAAAGTGARGRFGRMIGRVYFWPGGSLWLGSGSGRADWHDHHAHQVTVSLAGSCRFRASRDAPWTDYAGAVVPSHENHEFEAEGAIAHLFIEPETVEGRGLRAQFADGGVGRLPDAACEMARAALNSVQARGGGIDETVSVARQVATQISRASPPTATLDARLEKAISYLRGRMRDSSTLAEVAAVAALSPSRFRHLWVQETGTSFRAYVLWLRLQVAIETAMAGESWTQAAHEAGFADSAHLTRTFRRMFGINPATLVSA
jgi:AraC-like DNA-binding protein